MSHAKEEAFNEQNQIVTELQRLIDSFFREDITGMPRSWTNFVSPYPILSTKLDMESLEKDNR